MVHIRKRTAMVWIRFRTAARVIVAVVVVAHSSSYGATRDDTGSAAPAAFPTKPVRIIIATSASGGTDFAARMYGQKLTEKWGHSVVLDNRPGATGMIGMDVVAHANADGY